MLEGVLTPPKELVWKKPAYLVLQELTKVRADPLRERLGGPGGCVTFM